MFVEGFVFEKIKPGNQVCTCIRTCMRSLKRRNFILPFPFIFSRRITTWLFVLPVTRYPVYIMFIFTPSSCPQMHKNLPSTYHIFNIVATLLFLIKIQFSFTRLHTIAITFNLREIFTSLLLILHKYRKITCRYCDFSREKSW